MKKLIFIILLALILISCKNKIRDVNSIGEDFSHQIINVSGGWKYQIIEFENHKYLSRSDGGIIHVESCQCKK